MSIKQQATINHVTTNAMSDLKQALESDPSYAYAWHCALKMSFLNELERQPWIPLTEKATKERNQIANKAAGNFMLHTFGVPTDDKMSSWLERKK